MSSPTGRPPQLGELALGRNALVAFMPWNGYNFEDSILISERIVKRRRVHLHPHRGVRGRWRATPSSGPRKITRDIPNVSEESLRNLDEAGIDLYRRRGEGRRHPGRQGHAQGRDPADSRREAAARHLRREGRPTCATPRSRCRPGVQGTVVDVRVFKPPRRGEGRARHRHRATPRSSAWPRTATTRRRSSSDQHLDSLPAQGPRRPGADDAGRAADQGGRARHRRVPRRPPAAPVLGDRPRRRRPE